MGCPRLQPLPVLEFPAFSKSASSAGSPGPHAPQSHLTVYDYGVNYTRYAQVLEEHDASGVKLSYVIGDDILAQSSVVSGQSWLLYDGHGSTRALTDTSGAITDRYSYDAYGQMLGGDPGATNAPATDLLYSGEQYDPDLQQQYLRARYYDQANGRFNRVDPWGGSSGDPQSLHKYAYCHGNPVMGTDPSGEMTLILALAGIATIAVLLVMYLPGIIKAKGKAKRSAHIAAGMKHLLYRDIRAIFRNLEKKGTTIPQPIQDEAPQVTWGKIGAEVTAGLGAGEWRFVDLETPSGKLRAKNKPNGPHVDADPPGWPNKPIWLAIDTWANWAERDRIIYWALPYEDDGTLDHLAQKQKVPWAAALAHELMHIYRHLTGQHTGRNSVEEYGIAAPVTRAYRDWMKTNRHDP